VAETVYILCALTSLLCSWMLFRGYARSGARFVLWSAFCFVGLTLNNILLFIDKVVFPEPSGFWGLEFQVWRSLAAMVGLVLLLYGLIWEAE
jgi:hypothetical protein